MCRLRSPPRGQPGPTASTCRAFGTGEAGQPAANVDVTGLCQGRSRGGRDAIGEPPHHGPDSFLTVSRLGWNSGMSLDGRAMPEHEVPRWRALAMLGGNGIPLDHHVVRHVAGL